MTPTGIPASVVLEILHTTLWNSSGRFHSPDLLYIAIGLDLQELLVVAVDSVAPEASTQQAGNSFTSSTTV